MDDPFRPSIDETLVRVAIALEKIAGTLDSIEDHMYSVTAFLDNSLGKDGTMEKLLISSNKRNNIIAGVNANLCDGIAVEISGEVTTYSPPSF